MSELILSTKQLNELGARSLEQGQGMLLLKSSRCSHEETIEVWVRSAKRDKGQAVGLCLSCGELLDYRLLRKARVDWRGNPNYRWITVHGHGEKESPGQPVLIRMNPDGSAHIVGGAGGALNYKVLTRLRSPKELRLEARARRAARREREEHRRLAAQAEDVERREELLTKVHARKEQVEREYLAELATVQGWEAVQLPKEQRDRMTEKQIDRFERARYREQLSAGQRLIDNIQDQVLKQHNEQIAQDLQGISVEELDTGYVDSTGHGYIAAIERLAEENGFDPERARAAAEERRMDTFRAAEEAGYIESADQAEAYTQMLQAGATAARIEDMPFKEEGLHKPQLETALVDPTRAKELLVAHQQYKEAVRELERTRREITGIDYEDIGKVPAGVALVPDEPLSEEQALERVETDLGNRALREAADTLLGEVYERFGGRENLQRHVGTGHYTQYMEICRQITGAPMPVDRHVADLLGNEGTAVLLAEYLREQMSPEEYGLLGKTLREWHVRTQAENALQAVKQADEEGKAAAQAIAGLPDIATTDGLGLLAAQAANEERRKHLAEAQRLLGTTLGRLEALGELNSQLLAERPPGVLSVSLGQMSTKRAIQIGTAVGLDFEQDFDVISDGPNKFAQIKREAFAKLIHIPDREFIEQYEDVQAIKRGEMDEEGWMPYGIKRRASADYNREITPAYYFSASPEFEGLSGDDLKRAIEDYIGGCLADDGAGSLDEIRLRMLSPEFQTEYIESEQRRQYQHIASEILHPGVTTDTEKANELAEQLVARATAGQPDRTALDNQTVDISEPAFEAMYLGLADVPYGKVAFTPLSSLSRQDQGAVRDYFWDRLTDEKPPTAADTRKRRAEVQERTKRVVGQQMDIFGATKEVTYGETEAGKAELEELSTPPETAWDRYVKAHKGLNGAYRALQDCMKGELSQSFARHYARVTGRELKTGTDAIHGADRHLIGLMRPEELERILGAERGRLAQLYARVAQRERGKFAPGERKELAMKILERARKLQLRLFAGKPLNMHRVTLGRTAEGQMRRVWSRLAPRFDAKKPVQIPYDVRMDGPTIHQQRAIKMLERAKRMTINHSTGSGKTLTGLGGFTELKNQGKVRRGLYIVPPKIVGQFGSEMLRFTEPGLYRHFADPAANADERRAAYGDRNIDMVAVSHQALRDDLTWAVAQQRFNGDVKQSAGFLRTAPEGERGRAVREATAAQGWDWQFTMLDEGHDALNRKGKPNSLLANALDSLTADMPYYINATATPVKNDISEAFDLLHKVRPDRYPQSKWDEFHRRFGLDTVEAKEALQREVAPYFYARNVDNGVIQEEFSPVVDLSSPQIREYREIVAAYQTARHAKSGSKGQRNAIARMCRPEELEGLTPKQRRTVLDRKAKFLSATRDHALNRAIHGSVSIPWQQNAKIQKVLEIASKYRTADQDEGQVPGVIFAVNRESNRQIREALKANGYRVGWIDGSVSGEDAELRRRDFNAEINHIDADPRERIHTQREVAKYDILVCSDAASMGLNLQRGGWLVHYDQPWTAKTHQQRTGRINRLTQSRPDVQVYNLFSDTPFDRRRREIVEDKYDLLHTFNESTELLDDTGLAAEWRRQVGEELATGLSKYIGAEEALQPVGV